MCFAALGTQAASAALFQGLGFLPGGNSSTSQAISDDGTVIIGSSNSAQGSQGFVWTAGTGMIGIGDLPGGGTSSSLRSISSDGTVAVGTSQGNFDNGFLRDFTGIRWTYDGGLEALTSPSNPNHRFGNGAAVSDGGGVIVGRGPATFAGKRYITAAYIWTDETGAVPIDLEPGVNHTTDHLALFTDVAADGSRAMGRDVVFSDGTSRNFERTADGTITWLPGIGADQELDLVKYSRDGSIILANRYTDTQGDFVTLLGPDRQPIDKGQIVPGGLMYAIDFTPDAKTIVGSGHINDNLDYGGWIYDDTHGYREILSFLTNEHGLGAQVAGWTVDEVTGISTDGLTIVGYGTNPHGQSEAWVAKLNPGDLDISALANFKAGSSRNLYAEIKNDFQTISQDIGTSVLLNGIPFLTASQEVKDFGVVSASTFAATSKAIGVNRAEVSTIVTNDDYTAYAEASNTWHDYFMITGGEGAGLAQFYFRLHGEMGAGGEAALGFAVDSTQLFGDFAGIKQSELLEILTSDEYGGIGEFSDIYIAYVDFTYGLPFRLDVSTLLQAYDNASIDFKGTATVLQIVLPDGSTLHSSGLLSGDVSPDVYGLAVAAIPEPATMSLLLIGAVSVIRRRRR